MDIGKGLSRHRAAIMVLSGVVHDSVKCHCVSERFTERTRDKLAAPAHSTPNEEAWHTQSGKLLVHQD